MLKNFNPKKILKNPLLGTLLSLGLILLFLFFTLDSKIDQTLAMTVALILGTLIFHFPLNIYLGGLKKGAYFAFLVCLVLTSFNFFFVQSMQKTVFFKAHPSLLISFSVLCSLTEFYGALQRLPPIQDFLEEASPGWFLFHPLLCLCVAISSPLLAAILLGLIHAINK